MASPWGTWMATATWISSAGTTAESPDRERRSAATQGGASKPTRPGCRGWRIKPEASPWGTWMGTATSISSAETTVGAAETKRRRRATMRGASYRFGNGLVGGSVGPGWAQRRVEIG